MNRKPTLSTATRLPPCKSGPPGMVATEYLSHNKFLRATRHGSRWIGWWRFNSASPWNPVEKKETAGLGDMLIDTFMSPTLAMDAARLIRTSRKRDLSRTTRHRI